MTEEKRKLIRGTFISVEGPDCSGKTTVTKLLKEKFEALGYDVLTTSTIDGSPLGGKVREAYLAQDADLEPMTEALLLYAVRHEVWHKTISPALVEGKIVICDRYCDSTFAYQGYAKGLGNDKIGMLQALSLGQAKPDTTLYLHASEETLKQRLATKQGKDKHENMDWTFHQKVIRGYGIQLTLNRARMLVVSTDCEIEQTNEHLNAIVHTMIEEFRMYKK